MANFTGTAAKDTFNGGEAGETAFGNGGNDTLNGNGGDDTLQLGPRGASTASGGAGDDTLNVEDAGPGSKTLLGGEGDDRINIAGRAINYVIDGGEGTDRLGIFGSNSVDFSRSTVISVEEFASGDANDVVVLAASQFVGFDMIDTGAGNDVVKVRVDGATDVSAAEFPDMVGVEALQMIGGYGDDSLTVSIEQFAKVNSFHLGAGWDTLNVVVSGDIDLTTSSPRLRDAESVNLVGSGSVRMTAAQFAEFTSIASELTVTLADKGARLRAYTPEEITALAAGRVDTLDATDDVLTLTVAQFRALGSLVLSADDMVTLADTGSEISGLSVSEFEALAQKGFDRIDVTDGTVALTVADYLALGTVRFVAADVVTVMDARAKLEALSIAELAALASRGIDRLDASDATLSFSVAQALATGTVAFAASDVVTVTGSGAEIAALTPDEIGVLSRRGVDRFDATNDAVTLTKAQAAALGAITFAAGDSVVIADAGAQLAKLTPGEMHDLWTKGVDRFDSTGDALTLTIAQYSALSGIVLSPGDLVTMRDTGAGLAALSAEAIAALAGNGIDRIDATDDALSLTVAQYRALGAVTLVKADHVILADTMANLATLTADENAALASKGIDEVLPVIPTTIETTMASYTLDAFASKLKFVGTGPFSGTGNSLDNEITGGDSGDTLSGLAGDDTLIGGNGDDVLIGGLGSDVLNGGGGSGDYASYVHATTGVFVSLANPASNTGEAAGDTYIGIERLEGSSFSDTLIGDAGNNTLRGGAGADVLNGGSGSDYASYTTATAGLVASLANPGVNTGDAAGDTYVSIESLSGSNFDDVLVGNASDNTFQGNLGADHIDGGAGFDYASYFNATLGVTASLANAAINTGEAAGDTYAQIEGLTGSAFADTLVGDGGDNWLLGGGGADQLDGGAGFDTAAYGNSTVGLRASLLDPSANTGEASGDVYTSIEGLSGSSYNDILIGNAVGNMLSGGFGADSLSGGDGNDQLLGGAGDDFLEGGAGADQFNGGDGTDTVSYYQYTSSGGTIGITASLENASINTGDAAGDTYVSIENLAGTFANDTLIGTSGNNVIDGVYGADVFNGRGGMDTLIGNGGGDTYVFNSAIGAGNLATIKGFAHGQDHFNLDNAIFTQLGAEGALGAGAFVNGAAALDANDRIIFNSATGSVSYDADGSGAGVAVVFATMQDLGVALDHTDFLIV